MDYDQAYANAEFIPNANAYPTLWATAAAEFRTAMAGRARLGLSYGPGAREKFDLFAPAGAARGLVVFVHGGYWKAFGRADWSHLAAGAVARGWAVALPSYTLAPDARIAAITRATAAAIVAAAAEVTGPIRLVGHSAGGHLVARMNCGDVTLPAEVAARIGRIVAISPLGDLRPLLRTQMNAVFRLTPEEAAAESPALVSGPAAARRGIDTLVWVGAEERPAFLDQAMGLAEAWQEARLQVAPGRHHFDVIAPLTEAGSGLVEAVLRPAAAET